MADYTQITDFSVKDGLTTGDPEKIILGADVDGELSAIATAIASKFDSSDVASQAQAEAETLDTVLITPLKLANWSDANAGIVGEIHALADPDADGIIGWDDSEAADSNVIFYTMGTGLAFNGTTIELDFLGLEDLTDPGAKRIVYWDSGDTALDWLVPSTGLTTVNDNLEVDILGLEDLADPGADRIFFWDDTAGMSDWLIPGNGLEIDNGSSTLGLIDVAATTGNPVDISSGSISLSLNALTSMNGNELTSNDDIIIEDGTQVKRMTFSNMGIPVTTVAGTTDTLDSDDINRWLEYTSGSAVAVTLDSGVGKQGNYIIINQAGAGQVTVSGTATLNSAIGEKTRAQDSVIILFCTAADTWTVYGDAAA